MVAIPEMISKLCNVVTSDGFLEMLEITDAEHISAERLFNILLTYLCLKNLSVKWLQRLHTEDQM